LAKAKAQLSVATIRQNYELSQEGMGALLRVSGKTVRRWEQAQDRPRKQDQILRLVKMKEIRDLGQRIYTKEGFLEFLKTPLPVFDGKTAFDLIRIGDYDRVIGALAADLEGMGF
jgi:hypothetical protein